MEERHDGPERRLSELGLSLPDAPQPAGAYLPAVREDDWIFTAGQLPIEAGKLLYRGKVGLDLDEDAAYAAARLCALNGLAAAAALLEGGLRRIRRVVKLSGYVNSAPGFTAQPAVLNGASELMLSVFGERGRHARTAAAAPELPLNAAVEVELILRVE